MQFEQSKTLASRSYVGLVLSQFLAAFNDQAIHIVAIFYASDMLVRYAHVQPFDHKLVLAIVTACFISPFFFFSPWAGVLADKFSKRSTIIFWKLAEVVITGLALVAFLLPHATDLFAASSQTMAMISAYLLIACVFMMGTHSAFFVPAKYGVMPEILHTSVLSRGNGLLEGTSFVSQILGTSFGGILYAHLAGKVKLGVLYPGREWIIGAILLGLAIVGAVFSFLLRPMPAAAPEKKLSLNPLVPMAANFRELRRSRSLVLATIGIAFFTFMTLYMRQSLFFEGETAKELASMKSDLKHIEDGERQAALSESERVAAASQIEATVEGMTDDQEAELRIAMLVALIGLGVGIGCSVAGQMSGNRLELGLVPVGGVGMMLMTLALAIATPANLQVVTIICLISIGFSAGLYIVPMYTLLQHRAPKDSKGSMVATSNFLNVTGGLVAVIVFYFVTFALQSLMGLNLTGEDAVRDTDTLRQYISQLQQAERIPPLLFVSASVITAITLFVLIWQRPDFLIRALSWLRLPARRRLRAVNADHLPANGPLILATNCRGTEQWMYVVAVIDRYTRFVAPAVNDHQQAGLLRFSKRLGLSLSQSDSGSHSAALTDHVAADHVAIDRAVTDQLVADGVATLRDGNLVGLFLGDGALSTAGAELLARLQSQAPSSILPVYCGEYPAQEPGATVVQGRMSVVVGDALPAGTSLAAVAAALAKLGR